MFTKLQELDLERETGFEPATNSLEGCDSSQLSYSRLNKINILRTNSLSTLFRLAGQLTCLQTDGVTPAYKTFHYFRTRKKSHRFISILQNNPSDLKIYLLYLLGNPMKYTNREWLYTLLQRFQNGGQGGNRTP